MGNKDSRKYTVKALKSIASDMRTIHPFVADYSPENAKEMLGAAGLLEEWAGHIANTGE